MLSVLLQCNNCYVFSLANRKTTYCIFLQSGSVLRQFFLVSLLSVFVYLSGGLYHGPAHEDVEAKRNKGDLVYAD